MDRGVEYARTCAPAIVEKLGALVAGSQAAAEEFMRQELMKAYCAGQVDATRRETADEASQ